MRWEAVETAVDDALVEEPERLTDPAGTYSVGGELEFAESAGLELGEH